MTFQTETLRRVHRALVSAAEVLTATARDLPRAVPAARRVLVAEALRVVHDTVLPNLERHEESLFPEVAGRNGGSQAAACMARQRVAIRGWIDRLAAASLDDSPQLEQLLFGLSALLTVYVEQEEHLYLRVLEPHPIERR